jgi:uncharacterized membrane protein YtjA (UPF0391 family)
MQKSKGFVSAVMLVVSLAAVACASTRTTKSMGEQVDDSVTTGRVKAALIAAAFGFAGIAAGAAGIAKILFFVFLILAVVSFIANTARR